MRIWFVFGVSSLALLTMASLVAVASPPAVETQSWSGQYLVPCGDFDIVDTWGGDAKIRYFWKSDGSLDRYHITGEFVDEMVNPSNGKSVNGRTRGYNFFQDLDDAGVWKLAGLMFHVNVPGAGVVIIDAGYMIGYDDQVIYMKGNHQFNGGDLEKLCSFLR